MKLQPKKKKYKKPKVQNSAYDHWQEQLTFAEKQLIPVYENFQIVCNEIGRLDEKQKLAVQKINDDIALVVENHKLLLSTHTAKLESLKIMNQNEMNNLQKKQNVNHVGICYARNNITMAKIRCKDPLFKNMVQIFPLTI